MPPAKLQTLGTKNTIRNSVVNQLARRPISARSHKNVIDANNVSMVGKRKADASPLKNEKVKRSAFGNLTNAVLNLADDHSKHNNSKITGAKGDVGAQKARDTTTILNNGNQQNNSENAAIKSKTKLNIHTMESIFPAPTGSGPRRQTKVMTRAASRAAQPAKQQQQQQLNESNGLKTRALASIENKIMTNTKDISTTVVKVNKKNNNKNDAKKTDSSSGKETCDVQIQKPTTRRISNEFDLNENEDSHYMSALEDL